MWFSASSENLIFLWFLLAVHFFSELTEVELIITIFEHETRETTTEPTVK